MKTMRRFAMALAVTILGVGTLGMTAPAHADTNWPCGGCLKASTHH